MHNFLFLPTDMHDDSYIYIGVGDEPEGCTSRVYKDKHREIVGLGDHYKIEVRSEAPDYDWEKALYANA